jgi:hypothetical protein
MSSTIFYVVSSSFLRIDALAEDLVLPKPALVWTNTDQIPQPKKRKPKVSKKGTASKPKRQRSRNKTNLSREAAVTADFANQSPSNNILSSYHLHRRANRFAATISDVRVDSGDDAMQALLTAVEHVEHAVSSGPDQQLTLARSSSTEGIVVNGTATDPTPLQSAVTSPLPLPTKAKPSSQGVAEGPNTEPIQRSENLYCQPNLVMWDDRLGEALNLEVWGDRLGEGLSLDGNIRMWDDRSGEALNLDGNLNTEGEHPQENLGMWDGPGEPLDFGDRPIWGTDDLLI